VTSKFDERCTSILYRTFAEQRIPARSNGSGMSRVTSLSPVIEDDKRTVCGADLGREAEANENRNGLSERANHVSSSEMRDAFDLGKHYPASSGHKGACLGFCMEHFCDDDISGV
jgi:hypothetical protein